MLRNQAVPYITEWASCPLVEFQHFGGEALVVDFVKACQWFGILSVQCLVLVHIHYAELVLLLRILALCVGSTLDFEEEPIAIAFRVCVRPYV